MVAVTKKTKTIFNNNDNCGTSKIKTIIVVTITPINKLIFFDVSKRIIHLICNQLLLLFQLYYFLISHVIF